MSRVIPFPRVTKKELGERLALACTCRWCQKGEAGGDADMMKVIQEYGHAVIPIIDSQPQITFTVGLKHSYNHPELIILGLKIADAFTLLNTCGRMIKDGDALETGRRYTEFANMPAYFRLVEPRLARKYIGRCINFYGGVTPTLLQFVWPDPKALFPWESGYQTKYNRLQPHLWGVGH